MAGLGFSPTNWDANFDLVWRGGSTGWAVQFIIAPLIYRPTVFRTGAFTMAGAGGFIPVGRAVSTQGAATWSGRGAAAFTSAVIGFTTTWDPSNKNVDIVLSNSNKTATLPSAHTGGVTDGNVRGTFARDTGFYFEAVWSTLVTGQPHGAGIGLVNASHSMDIYLGGDSNNGVGLFSNGGYMQSPGFGGNFGPTWVATDVMGLYIRSGSVDIYKNGTIWGQSFPGRPLGALYPAIGLANSGDAATGRFSGADIQFLPSGATPWNGV